MAFEVKNAKRKFLIEKNGKKTELTDPHPNMTIQEVISHHSSKHPELITASIDGPVIEKGVATYTFTNVIGTKG